jgi:hypothetical protein
VLSTSQTTRYFHLKPKQDMPEQQLDHPPLPQFGEAPPDFSVLDSASEAPPRPQGGMTEEQIAAAAALVRDTKVTHGTPTPPAPEPKPYEGMDDDAVEAARKMVDELFSRKRTPQPAHTANKAAPTAEARKQTMAERHPGWPPVTIECWLGQHGTGTDFKDFPVKMAKAHILMIEAGGPNDAIETRANVLQDIANMDPSKHSPTLVDDYLRDNKLLGTNMEPVVRSIYGTNKVVGSFDLRGEDLALGAELIDAHKEVKPDYSLGDFDAVVDDFTAKIRRVAELQRKRERIIGSQVEMEFERLMKAHPELKDLPAINVLMPMGAQHVTLLEDLVASDLGLDVRGDKTDPLEMNHRMELTYGIMAGGPEPSRELKTKAYAEYVIAGALLDNLGDTNKTAGRGADISIYLRDAASHFSEADIKYLFNTQRQDPFTTDRLDRVLKSVGARPLPLNLAEVATVADEIRASQPNAQ